VSKVENSVLALQRQILSGRATGLPDAGRIALGWLEHYRFAVALAGAFGLVFAHRMVVLQSQLALGTDAGDYLATMQQLFGTDVTGKGLTRPPLVGLALWPLVQIFGPLEATKLLAVAASVLIGVPFYLLCTRFTGRAVALATSLAFIFSLRYMDALNWGFLTLVSVGLFTLCFYLIHEILAAPSLEKGKVLALALATWALVSANRSSTVIYVFAVLAFAVVAFVVGGRFRGRLPRLLPAALLAMLLSLPIMPIYLDSSHAIGDQRFLVVAGSSQGLSGGWDKLRYFFEPASLWAAVAVAGLLGGLILLRRTQLGSVLIFTLSLAPFALCMLIGGETGTRAVYYLYLPVWLGFAVFADVVVRAARDRHVALAVVPVCVLGLLALATTSKGYSKLPEAAEWYGYLEAEHVTAIEAIDRAAPAGAGVAYPNGLGIWTKGLAGRRVQGRTPLLTGDHVMTNGWAFVADAYVAKDLPMDPALGIRNGQFGHLLYLDDRQIELEYGAASTARRITLADAESQESTTTIENGAFVDRRTYLLDGLRVVKEVTLPETSNRVTVKLLFESASGPVSRIVVPVQPAMHSTTVAGDPQQAHFAFHSWIPFTGDWWASVLVELVTDQDEPATLTLSVNEALAEPEIFAVAELRPESPRAEMTLAFTFRGRPSAAEAGLRSFTAEDVIRQEGITFAVVDKHPAKPWFGDPLDAAALAWLEGSPYFRPLWEEGNVAAYLVVAATPDGKPLALTPDARMEAVDEPR
jgi:hypothetical protein